MENLPNNLRGTVAQFVGIELRRPENLYMLSTSESTQRLDRPTFDYFENFFLEIKGNKFQVHHFCFEIHKIMFASILILIFLS